MIMHYNDFKVVIDSYINRLGNTSYSLRFYRVKPIPCDFYGTPAFTSTASLEYIVVRYQWSLGTCYYLMADSDGRCIPSSCRIKDLVPGFNWSYVKRALKERKFRHGK